MLKFKYLALAAVLFGSSALADGLTFPGGSSGGGAVSSVFGRTGDVVAATSDYTIAQIAGLATGCNTFLQTSTSANFAACMTDETGTGFVVLSAGAALSGAVTDSGSFAIAGCSIGTDVFCANGTATVGSLNVTSTTIPVNGIYESAASQIGISSNSVLHIIVTSSILEGNNASSWTMPTNAAPNCTTTPSLTVSKALTQTGISGDGSTKVCIAISGVDTFDFAAGGFTTKGTIPTVTGTGTPTIATGSTDTSGEVTSGTSATSVVITFAAAKTNAPFCTVTAQTQLAAFAYTISTAAITITQTATTGEKIDYICLQH